MASFHLPFSYLHYEKSMNKWRIHSLVYFTGSIKYSAWTALLYACALWEVFYRLIVQSDFEYILQQSKMSDVSV